MALTVLEVLVHLDKQDLPDDYVLMAVEVPGKVPIHESDLDSGIAAADSRLHPVIRVPSVIVPRESNFVFYPDVAGFEATVAWIDAFQFDTRLFTLSLGKRSGPEIQ